MATNSQPEETSEYRIFRNHYARLVHAIQNPLSLATQLFTRRLIDTSLLQQVNTLGFSTFQSTNTLLTAVSGKIQTDPSAFHMLLSALNEDPSMLPLVKSMERELLSTTSDAHGGSVSVKSRDGGKEQSLGRDGKSVTPIGIDHRQDHQYHYQHHNHLEQHSHFNHRQAWQPFPQLPYTSLLPVRPVQSSNQTPANPSLIYPYPPAFSPTLSHPGYNTTGHFQPAYPSYQSPPLPLNQVSYPPPFLVLNVHAPVLPVRSYPFQHKATTHSPSHQPANANPPRPPSPPHPVSPLEKYALYLRGYYTQHHAPCNKWPQLHTRRYINLAVIKNEYANRAALVKFRQQTIHGSIDDILQWKAPIRMEDILKPNCVYSYETHKETQYRVTQLLIEGAPGIGKSTFAWEVCQKWGQHLFFNDYSLVVLLKFRDKRVQEAKSVSDLFYHPHPKLQSEIIDCIVLSGGHGLLLILEGFDEAPALKRTKDSIFVRLFRGQELPKATVILTTRPSASAEFRQFCNSVNSRRVEIVGFSKKEIDEYIQCTFSDEQPRSDFKEYLSLYPHIHSMMYVPLNSAIVTHVYESCKSSGMVVPKTITQLYSSLIRTLLLRHLKDKEEYWDTCTIINSFKDFPQPVYDQFCEICKIAYTGIMSAETELIFQDLPSDFDPLGLMQTCPELYVDRGASVSYNFLHLTVQEYLAAYHISQQSRDDQVAFMRFENKKLEVVVRFLAGLSGLGRDLWDVVRGFASEDKPHGPLLMEETNFIKLAILHWLFESQDLSAITSVLGSDCVCFSHDSHTALPFDLYVLGYCITHSSCDWKLELRHCKLESVEIFLKALNLQHDQCQLPSTGQIKGVRLWEFDPAAVHLLVDNMLQMSVFHNLTHLGLTTCDLASESCNLFSKHTDLLRHLEYLNLSYNHLDRGGAMNLITSLTKFSTIRELNFSYTGIGFEDCMALNELLVTSKYIQVLDIVGNKLSPDSIQLIVDGLSHNTSLEKLYMSNSNFSSVNILHLASVLRVNTRLKELNIGQCNIQSSDSVHIAKALEENTTTQLQTLRLWDNPIGSEGAVAFASMLKKNQCLKKLWLFDDSVGVEGSLELIDSLKDNKTLEKLKLSEKCEPLLFSTLDKTLQDRINFSWW